MLRPNWREYFMKQAFLVAERSSCLHHHVGAVTVFDNRLLTTGYNGSVSGENNCVDLGYCQKEEAAELRGDEAKSGRGVDDCPAVHAEENALIQGAIIGVALRGVDIYITHQPCFHCSRRIAQVGLENVFYSIPYPDDRGLALLERQGINYERLEIPNLDIPILK